MKKIGEIPTKSILNEVKCNMQGNLLSNGCSVMIGDIYLLKEWRKLWYFHFDLHILPTVLNGTYVYWQETGIISKKVQNF